MNKTAFAIIRNWNFFLCCFAQTFFTLVIFRLQNSIYVDWHRQINRNQNRRKKIVALMPRSHFGIIILSTQVCRRCYFFLLLKWRTYTKIYCVFGFIILNIPLIYLIRAGCCTDYTSCFFNINVEPTKRIEITYCFCI